MSNLKQLILVSDLYTNDNNGCYPSSYDTTSGFDIRQRMGCALGYMKTLSWSEFYEWVFRQQWSPYRCPAHQWKWEGYTYPSYGINDGDVVGYTGTGGGPGFDGRLQGAIQQPSRMFAFSDRYDTTDYRYIWGGLVRLSRFRNGAAPQQRSENRLCGWACGVHRRSARGIPANEYGLLVGPGIVAPRLDLA